MTFASLTVLLTSNSYDTIVWVPNAIGSVCFLISGAIFYLSSPRRGWLPLRDHEGWWEAAINLLGCVLFGISAVTGYVSGGSPVSVAITNWTTTLGAVCFLLVALTACGLGVTMKSPRLRKLREIAEEAVVAVEHTVEQEVHVLEEEVHVLTSEVRKLEHEVEAVSEKLSAREHEKNPEPAAE
jgi:hypothetical protein